ncbi:MAG: SDR family oxidoreductase [Magnetococcales bacterium]|nr:SDR family oxidoreductase [Magnetococcales bacterium]
MKLENKVAVITGGGSGIGQAIARKFSEEGASIVIMGRDKNRLEETAQKTGNDTLIVTGDVTKMADLDRLYKESSDQFGKIDILVVNAGMATLAPFADVDEESFDFQTNVNFKAVFFTIQKSLSHLKHGASIVIISSIAQSRGFAGASVYGAAKAAIRALARTISVELCLERGIRANVISPGPIDTPGVEKLGVPQDQLSATKNSLREMVPLKRIGSPEEVATTALFLASNDSSFVVGEEIIVDGGVSNLQLA